MSTYFLLVFEAIETDELRGDFDPATDEIALSTRFVEMLWITVKPALSPIPAPAVEALPRPFAPAGRVFRAKARR